MICKTKHEVETQKYTINLYREITSTKTEHSNLLVSVFLLFINEHYRKTNKVKQEEQKQTNKKTNKKTNKNKREME